MSTVQASRGSYTPQVPSSLLAKDLANSYILCGDEVSYPSQINDLMPYSKGGPVLTVCTTEESEEPADGKRKRNRLLSTEGARRVAVGVAFIGNPASGGSLILKGLADYVEGFGDSKVAVFVGGIVGLKMGQAVDLTPELLAIYAGQGGTAPFCCNDATLSLEEMSQVEASCALLKLNGLVFVGDTKAAQYALLASEYFKQKQVHVKVLCVPSCAGMSLCNTYVETPLGADTAAKTLGQLSGNLAIDGASARKYWYFMTLDGNGSSYTTLETALQSNPNMAVFNEEYEEEGLEKIVQDVADGVSRRANLGCNFGTILISEGIASGSGKVNDLAALVKAEISKRKKEGRCNCKFDPVCFDFGLQIRSALPSRFDCDYGYALGATCAVLLRHNVSGYMAVVSGLKNQAKDWKVGAVPIVAMMNFSETGLSLPKAKIDLNGQGLSLWNSIKSEAESKEIYMNPGPLQFEGEIAESRMKILQVAQSCPLP
jgi:6-phosphofructokinase